MVMQSTGHVIEVNAYYPYRKIIQGLSTSSTYGKNNYKYNGKELQPELELNWLDYGARPLPTSHPMWFVPDPMIELHYEWSPYAYCYNNPINLIDPFGLDTAVVRVEMVNGEEIMNTSLSEVVIHGEQTRHQQIMNNPIVRNIHQTQSDDLTYWRCRIRCR